MRHAWLQKLQRLLEVPFYSFLILCSWHHKQTRCYIALRIACSTFGEKNPTKLSSNCGAPEFFIPKSVLESWLGEDFTISEIARLLCVSESTVYRRWQEYDLSKQSFTDISNQELDDKASIEINNFSKITHFLK